MLFWRCIMPNSKFDLNSIVKNVKSVIDPESALPPDEEKNPMAYRVFRLNELVVSLKEKNKEVTDELKKMETNFNEVLADLKTIADEKDAELKKDAPADDKKDDKKEDDKKDDKKEDDKEEDKK